MVMGCFYGKGVGRMSLLRRIGGRFTGTVIVECWSWCGWTGRRKSERERGVVVRCEITRTKGNKNKEGEREG